MKTLCWIMIAVLFAPVPHAHTGPIVLGGSGDTPHALVDTKEHRTLGTFPTSKACDEAALAQIKTHAGPAVNTLGLFYRFQCELIRK